jgi:hypothetical protein
LDKKTSKVMCSNVVSGIDEDNAGEIAHNVHEVRLAAIVGDFARGPEIDVKDIKGAAEGPGEDELAMRATDPFDAMQ